MTKLNAGTPVNSGYYFSLKTWTIQPIEHDGSVLPGEAGEQFLPLSMPVAIGLAPVLGAGFLMFMPVLGFYMTAKALTRPVVKLFHKTSNEVAATMAPGLAPGAAYLTGKPGDETASPKAPAQDQELEKLQAEIDARRGK
jgi:hypothetical protein